MITFVSTEVEMPSLSRFDYCDWIERVAKNSWTSCGKCELYVLR